MVEEELPGAGTVMADVQAHRRGCLRVPGAGREQN